MMDESERVVRQTMMVLRHFDYEVPVLYLAGGAAYVPVIALCEMLGLRADPHIQRWRKLALWANARKLPFRTRSGKRRIVWCLHVGAFPFLYACFNWSLVSPERRAQLRQATDEWIELSAQAHQEMQRRYREMRRLLFTFLTTYSEPDLSLRHYAQRLHALLDKDSSLRLDQLIAHGLSIIHQATTHARTMLQDQARTPIVDAFKVDPDGNVIENFSLPLLPVVRREDKEQFFEYFRKLAQWHRDFAAFLKEQGIPGNEDS